MHLTKNALFGLKGSVRFRDAKQAHILGLSDWVISGQISSQPVPAGWAFPPKGGLLSDPNLNSGLGIVILLYVIVTCPEFIISELQIICT